MREDPVGGRKSARPGHQAELRYQPGLDGLRALAVIGVLMYHGGVSWAGGGFLGVEVFFVLSGYLITSLLLAEWRESSTIGLRAFWARRARRLLPALFLVVAVIGIGYTIAGPLNAVPGLRDDGLATLLYVGNWHQLAVGSSYFVMTGPVSPLQHTWSLAIEEQFYVVWPLLLGGLFWVVRRQVRRASSVGRRSLEVLFLLTSIGALISAVEMALLFHGGAGVDRVYYGTDTRATGLLVGASLAVATALRTSRISRSGEDAAQRFRGRWLGLSSLAALGGVLAAMHFAGGGSHWLYPFGFLSVDLAVALVIAATTLRPASVVGRTFSLGPLAAIGRISYGLYLWHFPLFLWLDQGATGLNGAPLLLVRLGATLIVAMISFMVVEQPIRRRRLPARLVRVLLPAAAAGAAAALIAASAGGSQLPGENFAAAPAHIANLSGVGPACGVRLRNTKQYMTVPLPPSQIGEFEFHWIDQGQIQWDTGHYPNSGSVSFHTCPPRRVLLIGDSIAFSLATPMLEHENRYGVELANASILGCSFGTRGEIGLKAGFMSPPHQCAGALGTWERDVHAFGAQAVVVELGYRDEFDWRWNGQVVHLGQAAYTAYVQQQIDRYVTVLGQGGVPILFLTVPYVHPGALANGSEPPAASRARHALINSLLESAARRAGAHVKVLDIDRFVSPGNRYNDNVAGNTCRFDGVHFTIFCASLLQPQVLTAARELIGK